MIWKAPGFGGARRSKVLEQGIDIFPTMIELTGGKARPDLPGRSLKQALAGTPGPASCAIFTSAGYAELPPEMVEQHRQPQRIRIRHCIRWWRKQPLSPRIAIQWPSRRNGSSCSANRVRPNFTT